MKTRKTSKALINITFGSNDFFLDLMVSYGIKVMKSSLPLYKKNRINPDKRMAIRKKSTR